jgi:hypothetical protein
MKRLEEEGENALIQLAEPVNKFPGFVRYIVLQLKTFFPGLGKEKIAQVLARAGLHLGVTTAGRMLKEKPSKEVEEETVSAEDMEPAKVRIVTAKYPGLSELASRNFSPAMKALHSPCCESSRLCPRIRIR